VWLPNSEHRQVKATLFDDLTVFDDVVLLEWVRRYWFPCNIILHVPALHTRILCHNLWKSSSFIPRLQPRGRSPPLVN
jgi:hypothetical protein